MKSRIVIAIFALVLLASLAVVLRMSSPLAQSAPARSAHGQTLASLPPVAQASISAALGRDDPAYQVQPEETGYAARNPAQALDMQWTTGGVSVHSQDLSWGLTLRTLEYGAEVQEMPAAVPVASANRVEYRRGDLTEWYVNGPQGLEQGFTLAHPPTGQTSGEIVLTLALSGEAHAQVAPGGKTITLSRHDGLAGLQLTGLVAVDAAGQSLPTWFEGGGDQVRVVVATQGAQYPVVIDPFIQQAILTSQGGGTNSSGFSIAISGNTIVVGYPFAALGSNGFKGLVYVFVQPVTDWQNMTETAKLTASDGAANDEFGYSVAINGNTIVAGAPHHVVSSPLGPGAVYVFIKPKSGWHDMTERAKLTASDGVAGDALGASVAINDKTIVAGAWDATIRGKIQQGAVYVFFKPGRRWHNMTQTAKLTATVEANAQWLGASVAIKGNTIAAGAPAATVRGNLNQGAVYVFVKPGRHWHSMTQTAKLTASHGATDDVLGDSVAISENTIVAGAPNAIFPNPSDPGAVYVFVKPQNGWHSMTQTAKLTASAGATGDGLGFSVAISGKTIVAGAPFANINGNAQQGALYVFVEPQNGWRNRSETTKVVASDGAGKDQLGWSVRLSGNTLVGGAVDASASGTSNQQGKTYVFVR